MTFWLTIIGMGVVTYVTRLSFVLLLGQVEIPHVIRRALRLTPSAVFAAIILPELLRPGGTLDISAGNPRLLAGVLAGLVAWRTQNVLLTVGVGMAALWTLQLLMP